MRRILPFLMMFAFAAATFAQQAEPTSSAKPSAKLFASSQQSADMKKMVDSFAGLWKTTIHAYKGEWFPAEGTTRGRADIKAGPAGNSITEQFRSLGPLGNFAGHGVYWYDKNAGGYLGVWCDSMDPNGCGRVGKGNWEGDDLVFNNEIDMGPTKMHIRETYSRITKESYDFMIEAATGDTPLKKMMSIHYQRSTGKSADGSQ